MNRMRAARYEVAVALCLRGQAGRRVCWPRYWLGMRLEQGLARLLRSLRMRLLPPRLLTVTELTGEAAEDG